MTVIHLKKSELVCNLWLEKILILDRHRTPLDIRDSASIILTNFVRVFPWLSNSSSNG